MPACAQMPTVTLCTQLLPHTLYPLALAQRVHTCQAINVISGTYISFFSLSERVRIISIFWQSHRLTWGHWDLF